MIYSPSPHTVTNLTPSARRQRLRLAESMPKTKSLPAVRRVLQTLSVNFCGTQVSYGGDYLLTILEFLIGTDSLYVCGDDLGITSEHDFACIVHRD